MAPGACPTAPATSRERARFNEKCRVVLKDAFYLYLGWPLPWGGSSQPFLFGCRQVWPGFGSDPGSNLILILISTLSKIGQFPTKAGDTNPSQSGTRVHIGQPRRPSLRPIGGQTLIFWYRPRKYTNNSLNTNFTLCCAIEFPGRISVFRAGLRPDSNQEALLRNIGT